MSTKTCQQKHVNTNMSTKHVNKNMSTKHVNKPPFMDPNQNMGKPRVKFSLTLNLELKQKHVRKMSTNKNISIKLV